MQIEVRMTEIRPREVGMQKQGSIAKISKAVRQSRRWCEIAQKHLEREFCNFNSKIGSIFGL